eukprot:14385436-Alexandrium_andersonii.AAC.1
MAQRQRCKVAPSTCLLARLKPLRAVSTTFGRLQVALGRSKHFWPAVGAFGLRPKAPRTAKRAWSRLRVREDAQNCLKQL